MLESRCISHARLRRGRRCDSAADQVLSLSDLPDHWLMGIGIYVRLLLMAQVLRGRL